MRISPRTLLLISLTSCALLAASCSSGSGEVMGGSGTGRVQFVLSAGGASTALRVGAGGSVPVVTNDHDRPDARLAAANVTFSSILARTLAGQLIDVTISLPATVDVLSAATVAGVTLPIGFLPPGTYDQLVVVITHVEVVFENGGRVTLTPPGGGWTVVLRVQEPFTVVGGQTTTVSLSFRRDRSFEESDGHWEFHPWFECNGGSDD